MKRTENLGISNFKINRASYVLTTETGKNDKVRSSVWSGLETKLTQLLLNLQKKKESQKLTLVREGPIEVRVSYFSLEAA